MATSGSTDFNLTAAQIIEVTLLITARRQSGASAETDDQTELLRILNLLVKTWQNYAPHMWKRKIAFVPMQRGTQKYAIGNAAGNWHATEDYVFTRTSAALAASATVVTINSTTDATTAKTIAVADTVLIKKSDGTFDTDTVASVDSTTQITLTTGVTEAISSGAMVFVYTTKIPRPVEVYGMRRRTFTGANDTPSDNDVPVHHIAYKDYWDQPSKGSQGVVTQAMFDRQLSAGELYVWPEPDDTDILLVMTFVSPTEDLDATSDNPDCPQEWLMPLAYNLAYYGAPALRVDPNQYAMIKEQALELKIQALDKDSDGVGITIDPTDGRY